MKFHRLVLALCVAACVAYLYSCSGMGEKVTDASVTGGIPGGAAVLGKFLALPELPLFLLVAGLGVITHLWIENGHLSDTVEKLTKAAEQQAVAAHDAGLARGVDVGKQSVTLPEAAGLPSWLSWIIWGVPIALALYMLWTHSSRFRDMVRGLLALGLNSIHPRVEPPPVVVPPHIDEPPVKLTS